MLVFPFPSLICQRSRILAIKEADKWSSCVSKSKFGRVRYMERSLDTFHGKRGGESKRKKKDEKKIISQIL